MSEKRTLKSRLLCATYKLPMSISCEEFETFILAHEENELTWRQQIVFNAHLKICGACRTYLADYQASVNLGKSILRDAKAAPLPERLVQAILAARTPGS